jgi:hypothetical protein
MWEQPSVQISEEDGQLLGTISSAIHRLRTLGREFSRQLKGKGKAKETQLGEEPWRCMTQAAGLLKRAPALKSLLDVDQVVQGYVLDMINADRQCTTIPE